MTIDLIIYFDSFPWHACSASLKVYAHEDVSVGSWMMGVRATYIDDSRMCCGYSSQGNINPHHGLYASLIGISFHWFISNGNIADKVCSLA